MIFTNLQLNQRITFRRNVEILCQRSIKFFKWYIKQFIYLLAICKNLPSKKFIQFNLRRERLFARLITYSLGQLYYCGSICIKRQTISDIKYKGFPRISKQSFFLISVSYQRNIHNHNTPCIVNTLLLRSASWLSTQLRLRQCIHLFSGICANPLRHDQSQCCRLHLPTI